METGSANTGHKKIDYVEVLRFMLAFLTMVWHYYYFGPRVGVVGGASAGIFPLRYFSFSVEVFFIISGFIITASSIKRRPFDFLIGRMVRLGPCLLVCATISLAAGLVFGHHPSAKSYFASIFIIPLVFTNGADWSYWSLRLEIVFYTVIFLSAWCINIEKNVFRIALLLVTCDAVSIAAEHIFGVHLFGSETVQYPIERYLSFFAIGMMLYALLVQKRQGPGMVVALAAALFTGSFRCYEEANRIADLVKDVRVSAPVGFCILITGVALFVVFARSTTNRRAASLFSTLGKTSYPLYLLHQNMGYLLIRFVDTRFHPGFDSRPIVMVAMVLLAWVIALVVEPVLAVYYRQCFAYLAGTAGVAYSRFVVSKRTYGDIE